MRAFQAFTYPFKSRLCGPRPPAEHHPTVSAILKPFPPAYPFDVLSLNLPSDAARALQVPGFLFSLLVGEDIRLIP